METTGINLEICNKNDLINIFDSFILNSEFKIVSKESNGDVNIYKIKDNGRKFELHFILKNISTGGWSDKPQIFRIQVGNVKDNIVDTNKIRTHMLCGVVKFNDEYVLVVWNSKLYTNHNTNRSCYVKLSDIEKCNKEGYVMSNEFNQVSWLCNDRHFSLLIRDYINYNYVE